MTNEQIIFNQSIKLMDNGILEGTGQMITIEFDDGTTKDYEVPEPIHTYNTWKKLGYHVKQGEHAIAQFPVWKYTSRQIEGQEDPETKMFMKQASFFKFSQVEKIA